MITLKPDDRCFIIGQVGTGKSVLTQFLLKQYLDQGYDVTVYDSARDHQKLEEQYPQQVRRIVPALASLEDFEHYAEDIFREGNRILCVEEVEMVCSSSRIGTGFSRICHLGRHRKLGLILTARRIADCHKLPPSQTQHFFIFRMMLPNDVRYLRAFVGDAVDQLSTLKDFHFLHWYRGESEICSPVPLSEGSK